MATKTHAGTAQATISRLRREIRSAQKEIDLIGPRKRRSNRIEKLQAFIDGNKEILKELVEREKRKKEGGTE